MNRVNNVKYRRPLFLQMLIAGLLSIVSISAITSVCVIIMLEIDGKPYLHHLMESVSSILLGLLFICVPVSLSLLLFMHFTGLFKYIMYSIKMVVWVSVLLVVSNIMMNMYTNVFFVKTILLISVIIELYSVFVIKKLFQRRYLNFDKELEYCHIKPSIDERIDIIITIVLNIVILIPSLLFIFIFF